MRVRKKKGWVGQTKESYCISNPYVQSIMASIRIPIMSVKLYDHLNYADHCAFMPIIGIKQRGLGYQIHSIHELKHLLTVMHIENVFGQILFGVYSVFCLSNMNTIVWSCHLNLGSMIHCYPLLRIVRILSKITTMYTTNDTGLCYSYV